MNLQELIKNINFIESQWVEPEDFYGYIYRLLCFIKAKAKNGKLYEIQYACVAVINKQELKKNTSHEQIEKLKRTKVENCKVIVKDKIIYDLSKRTGIKYYHGFFKFIDFEMEI